MDSGTPANAKVPDGNQSAGAVPSQLTQLLVKADGGDSRAAAELLPLVYDELRRLARQFLARERSGQTLQATALVHEAWVKLVGTADPGWSGRQHFYRTAARAMRQIIVDQARRKASDKRGGRRQRVDADDSNLVAPPASIDVLALHEALERLEARDERKSRIVELRYFAGLTNDETAEVLGVTTRTIEREWLYIRAWLRRELDDEGHGQPSDTKG